MAKEALRDDGAVESDGRWKEMPVRVAVVERAVRDSRCKKWKATLPPQWGSDNLEGQE